MNNRKELLEEINKISLSKEQKSKVKNHIFQIEKMLSGHGINNIQRQGSFARGTVIRGEESDGFDLDLVIITNGVPLDSYNLNLKLKCWLEEMYSGTTQNVKISEKAVQVDVSSNFSIDITQIFTNSSNEEFVYNHWINEYEPSYALKFRNKFKEMNSKSNNALRDLARIYKHVRDSVKDINVKSLVIEMILYQGCVCSENYVQDMLDTLKNFEVIFKSVIENNYQIIQNPVEKKDKIETGIENLEQAEKIIILNKLVAKVIEGVVKDGKKFHSLKRRYHTIQEIEDLYPNSLIPKSKTLLSGGTFGGTGMD